MANVVVIDNVNIAKYSDRLENDRGLWTFAANEWYRFLEQYTPMDTSTLFKSVLIEPKEIHYVMEYAPAVYKGDHMNFQKTHHALACAHWDQAAQPTQAPKLIRSIEGYINAKGLLK